MYNPDLERNFYRRNSRKSSDELKKIISARQALLPVLKGSQADPILAEIEASKKILIERGDMQPE